MIQSIELKTGQCKIRHSFQSLQTKILVATISHGSLQDVVLLNPLPVDLSDEGGQAHGHEPQEFLHCAKLHYHGYIKHWKLKFRLHVTVQLQSTQLCIFKKKQ